MLGFTARLHCVVPGAGTLGQLGDLNFVPFRYFNEFQTEIDRYWQKLCLINVFPHTFHTGIGNIIPW
jgi:hypothetical protein